MRRFERNSHIGMTGDFLGKLRELSPYCFFSDMETANIELYHRNGTETFENMYLIRKEFADALNHKHIHENDVVFFNTQCDLKEYLIYFDTDLNTIKSLYGQIDEQIMKLFEIKLKREFSDAVKNSIVEITDELIEFYETKRNIENNLQENNYIDFVRNFEIFLKKIKLQQLLPIAATFLINNEKYNKIMEFIRDNITTTDNIKQNKIESILLEFEDLFKKNSLLPREGFLSDRLKTKIEQYEYNNLNLDFIPIKIRSIIDYTSLLWTSPSNKQEPPSPNPCTDFIKQELLKGFEKFEGYIYAHSREEKQDLFFDLKRILSKAESYLTKGDYSNFMAQCQKFIEKFFHLIHASTKPNGKSFTSINDILNNIKNKPEYKDSFLKYILDSMTICFEVDKLSFNKDYKPLNFKRNDFQHRDIGIDKYSFTKQLNYLVEEELGHENQTGLFYKWKEFFEMPDKNIFDQLNEKILELLKKPDLLNN